MGRRNHRCTGRVSIQDFDVYSGAVAYSVAYTITHPNRSAGTGAHTNSGPCSGAHAYSHADTNPDGDTCSYSHLDAGAYTGTYPATELQPSHKRERGFSGPVFGTGFRRDSHS